MPTQIPYDYSSVSWNPALDITNVILNVSVSDYTILDGMYFRIYKDNTDFLRVVNDSGFGIVPDLFQIHEKSDILFRLVCNYPTTSFYSANIGKPGSEMQVSSQVYNQVGNLITANKLGAHMITQNPINSNFNDTKYYIRAIITDTTADWALYMLDTNTPCIHPDMIVDSMNTKISEISTISNDSGFCENLKLGYANKFIRIPTGVFGNGIPTADLLLTPKHPIMFNGSELRAEELLNMFPGVEHIKLENPVMVYTLAFDTRKTVKMHGVDVWQWGMQDFSKFCDTHNYVYKDCLIKQY